MKRQKTVKRLLALLPAAAVLLLSAAGPAFGAGAAARQNDLRDADIMDPSEKGSLTVYKYDMTAAKEAGVDLAALSASTGEADDTVEQAMREYAVEGVEFSYLYCGKAETYSHRTDQGTEVELVYEMPSDLTGLLGMKPEDAFDMSGDVAEPCTAENVYHYSAAQISDALKAFLGKRRDRTGRPSGGE